MFMINSLIYVLREENYKVELNDYNENINLGSRQHSQRKINFLVANKVSQRQLNLINFS